MKVKIEMLVPDDLDPSTLLERMQAVAVEFAEEYAEMADDEDGDEDTFYLGDGSEVTREHLENEVSVEVCR
jgi:hypothetical protein